MSGGNRLSLPGLDEKDCSDEDDDQGNSSGDHHGEEARIALSFFRVGIGV